MKTIMCYGDSNTWGFMPKLEMPDVESKNRYPWDVRWTGKLQAMLGSDYRVLEEGLNGRTTMFDCPMEDHRNGLNDIDVALLTHAPIDLVVIMLGTNDTKIAFRMTDYIIAHGIERLIDKRHCEHSSILKNREDRNSFLKLLSHGPARLSRTETLIRS